MQNNTNMTQQEILTDILTEEKSMVKEYAGNITESASPQLRQMLLNIMSECSVDQFEVFNQMKARNMYTTKNAQQQDLQTAKQQMQTLRQQTGI